MIGLLKLATFQLQDRMFSSFSAQSLKRYGHFSDLKVEIALISITAMLKNVDFFFGGGGERVPVQQSTTSERSSRLATTCRPTYQMVDGNEISKLKLNKIELLGL